MTLDVHYMAMTVERERLSTRAERDRAVAEARSAARPHGIGQLRRAAGAVLILAGERVHGAPYLPHRTEILPAVGALEP
ncbi:MAG: hypothetical protein M3Q71_06790 [Chloroflexota bacterium]|nr:hypothetical protein [Chloroflexota bacterium]